MLTSNTAWKKAPPEQLAHGSDGITWTLSAPVPIRRDQLKSIWSNGASRVLDCVDLTVDIVGHQDLTAEGPEAWRHYSWSFKVRRPAMTAMGVTCSSPVNLKDGAVLARYDHVVPKCAHMVERNRGVVRDGAPETNHKRREDTSRELKDVIALCDENVARGEPGRRGLNWSDSHVFFDAGTSRRRTGIVATNVDIPVAVDHIEILVAVLGHEHSIRDSGHAVRALGAVAKGVGLATAGASGAATDLGTVARLLGLAA